MAPYILALTIEIHLADSHSLKDKRAVVRSVVDGARRRFGVASAETDHADLLQRAQLCFACVSGSPTQAERVIDEVERFVWSFTELEVTSSWRAWMEGE